MINLSPLDILIFLLLIGSLLAIIMRRDPRIATVVTCSFLLASAIKEFFVLHTVYWSIFYLAVAFLLFYQTRHVFMGEDKGKWRNWPWH